MIKLKWYEYDDNQIFCSECVLKMKSTEHQLTPEERMDWSKLKMLSDSDVVETPLQCDECLTQNEAYDELGDEPL